MSNTAKIGPPALKSEMASTDVDDDSISEGDDHVGGASWLSMAILLAPLFHGCMVPTYNNPAGFSSSYFRRLYPQEHEVLDPPPLNLHSGETSEGVLFPSSIKSQWAPIMPEPQPQAPRPVYAPANG